MKKLISILTEAGFAKLAYAGIAVLAALLGLWWAFWASLGIFGYVNGNIIWKKIFPDK